MGWKKLLHISRIQMKTRRRRSSRRRSRRRQKGGRVPVIRRYRGGIPEADDRKTIVFRPVDQDDPHGSSSATFSLDKAFEQSAHIDQYA
jgi:hypothetical protein